MDISQADWIAYKDKLSAISDTAAEKFEKWLTWKGGYQNVSKKEMINMAYALSTKYGEAAASLAAQMYDETAALSGVTVPAAEVANSASYGEIAKAINGVTKTLTTDKNISNVVARHTKMAGADTTLKNAARDGAEFAWIPAGDTCIFCLEIASNGWQHISAKSMKNGHAEHIHANCDCTYSVRFDGKSNVKGYNPDKYKEMFKNAEGNTSQEKVNSLRRIQYQENKDKINAQKRLNYAIKKAQTTGISAGAKKDTWINNLSTDARDKFGEIIKRGTEKMKHGFSCFGDTPYDRVLAYGASNIIPKKNYFDVAMHGTPTAVCFGSDKANMSPRLLANIIKKNPDYHGENIRLFCCKTGQTEYLESWQYCFAEELSNILGVVVEAPDDLCYIRTDGSWYVGLMKKIELVTFTPNQRRRYK